MSPGDVGSDIQQVAALGECVEKIDRVLAGTEDVRTYAQGYADALAWMLGQVDDMRRLSVRREAEAFGGAERLVAKLRAMTLGDVAEMLRVRTG